MRFCFVSTTRGSHFMTELLRALASAVEAAGHGAELVFDEFPPRADGDVYVVIPHEFEAWGRSGLPDAEQRAQTIALCTENPGTEWFEATYRLAADFGAAVSINRSSAAELRRRGVRCEHLQLGYTAGWDCWRGDDRVERPIDVLYLGAADPRRDPLLAGIGATLWARRCQFLVPPLEPRTGPRSDFLREQDKYARLAKSKILLNLHRTTSAALEWMRFLEAICNGCVVISEPSLDGEPLVAGEHFAQAPADRLAEAVNALLDEPERVRAIRERAYEFVRTELPIEPAGERLAELASELPRRRAPAATPPDRPARDALSRMTEATAPLDISIVLAQTRSAQPPAGPASGRALVARRDDRRLPTIGRRLSQLRRRARRGLSETPSYAAAEPRVSVLSEIFDDREHEGVELLESLAASHGEELEIVVLAAGSSDGAGRGVARFLEQHPTVPALVIRGEECPLGGARNLLAERARGELLLALPRDGGIFPTTVRRLALALDGERRAGFSYPMIVVVEDGAAVELRGSLPWEHERLTRENWIDVPALIRRERLLELGGYATDPRLDGLEDFDLWCRFAEASAHGVHVPQVLGWHSSAAISRPREVAKLPPASIELIRARSPRLFAEKGSREGAS